MKAIPMKHVTFLAVFSLTLISIQALGMEKKTNQETPAVSPAISIATLNFDSAPTSPIQKKRHYESEDELPNMSWKELKGEMAENYRNIEDIFAKIMEQKAKTIRTRDNDSESSSSKSSSYDSDTERILKYL
jgi:hypothetical protein